MKLSVIVNVLFLLKLVDSASNDVVETGKVTNGETEVQPPRRAQIANRRDVFLESRRKRCESCRESKRCKISGKCEFCNIICRDLDIVSTTTPIPVTTEIVTVPEATTNLEVNSQGTLLNKLLHTSYQKDEEIIVPEKHSHSVLEREIEKELQLASEKKKILLNDEKLTREEIHKIINDVKAWHKEVSNTHLHSRSIPDDSLNTKVDTKSGSVEDKAISKTSSEDASSRQFQFFLQGLEEKVENIAELIRKTCGQPVSIEKVVDEHPITIAKKPELPIIDKVKNSDDETQKALQTSDNKAINVEDLDQTVGATSDNIDEVVGSTLSEDLEAGVSDNVVPESRFTGEGIFAENVNAEIGKSGAALHKSVEIHAPNINPLAQLEKKVTEVKDALIHDGLLFEDKVKEVGGPKDIRIGAGVSVDKEYDGGIGTGDHSLVANEKVHLNAGKTYEQPRGYLTKDKEISLIIDGLRNEEKINQGGAINKDLVVNEGIQPLHESKVFGNLHEQISDTKLKSEVQPFGTKVIEIDAHKDISVDKPKILATGEDVTVAQLNSGNVAPSGTKSKAIFINKGFALGEGGIALQDHYTDELDSDGNVQVADTKSLSISKSPTIDALEDIGRSIDSKIKNAYVETSKVPLSLAEDLETKVGKKIMDLPSSVKVQDTLTENLPIMGNGEIQVSKADEVYLGKSGPKIVSVESLDRNQDGSNVDGRVRDQLSFNERFQSNPYSDEKAYSPVSKVKEIYIEKSRTQPVSMERLRPHSVQRAQQAPEDKFIDVEKQKSAEGVAPNLKHEMFREILEESKLPLAIAEDLKNKLKEDVNYAGAKFKDVVTDALNSKERFFHLDKPKESEGVTIEKGKSFHKLPPILEEDGEIDIRKSPPIASDQLKSSDAKLTNIAIEKLKSDEELAIEMAKWPIIEAEKLKHKVIQKVDDVDAKAKDILFDKLNEKPKFEEVSVPKSKPILISSDTPGVNQDVHVEKPYQPKFEDIAIEKLKSDEELAIQMAKWPLIEAEELKNKVLHKVSDADAKAKDILFDKLNEKPNLEEVSIHKSKPIFVSSETPSVNQRVHVGKPYETKFKDAAIEKLKSDEELAIEMAKLPFIEAEKLKNKVIHKVSDVDAKSKDILIDKLNENPELEEVYIHKSKPTFSDIAIEKLKSDRELAEIALQKAKLPLIEAERLKNKLFQKVSDVEAEAKDILFDKFNGNPKFEDVYIRKSKPTFISNQRVAPTFNDEDVSIDNDQAAVYQPSTIEVNRKFGPKSYHERVNVEQPSGTNTEEVYRKFGPKLYHALVNVETGEDSPGVVEVKGEIEPLSEAEIKRLEKQGEIVGDPSLEQRFAVEESGGPVDASKTVGDASSSDLVNQGSSKPYGVVAKLIPEENNSDKVIFVGDGMKLPFNLKKNSDGSYHLSMDLEKLCQPCNDQKAISDVTSHTISKRDVNPTDTLFYSGNWHKKRKPLPAGDKKFADSKLSNYARTNSGQKKGGSQKEELVEAGSEKSQMVFALEKMKLVNNVIGWLRGFIDPRLI
ncbi:hypothetical protein PPYR_09337 [Photinus pyralis]|uniref:Uncharacterized protein n=1 Tax=Photinus pyralis TaxID=7054 RepID=A0A5N4ALZ9_PHOPY|nr:uncharacterized protein LOC116170125 [Photinus pyralis]KAB0798344.1 hypothetical protein PPYR_09337 [Photinus pyralis]